jgi:hypothetical protein
MLAALGADPNDRQSQLYRAQVRSIEYRCLSNAKFANIEDGISTIVTARPRRAALRLDMPLVTMPGSASVQMSVPGTSPNRHFVPERTILLHAAHLTAARSICRALKARNILWYSYEVLIGG